MRGVVCKVDSYFGEVDLSMVCSFWISLYWMRSLLTLVDMNRELHEMVLLFVI